ncbi:condensation domain-containing protein, partial [Streptomyces sp. AC154]|uniref:condensation domain-containing protein n=1 Tax=Streptomyces sp. AC154 TaxID=3143184 RepID=UPI003F7ED8B7
MSTASAPSDGLLALTSAQLGIWNAQRLEPESPYYVVGDVVEISGTEPVDADALAEAVRATTEEAETLRLRVYDTPDGPRQTVSGEPVGLPEVVDVSGAADPVAAAQALVDAERARTGEACRGMTDRVLYARTVIRLSDREVWYTQLGHHLVFDGYTAAMLARRTAARYTALVRGTEPPDCTFGGFADLVAADRAYRESDRFTEDRAYWVERFTPLPELDDAAETDTAGGSPERTLTARAVVTPEETARLRAFAGREGVAWGEALIACYAAFLHRMLGRTDLVFALPLMCRAGSAELRTPAMAVNVLPLRVTVRGGDGLGELSRRVAAAMREMREHQRYRGEDLPRDLGAPGAGALLHGRGINLKAFDLAIDFAGAGGVMRNVAGGPPEDMGLSVLQTRDGGLLLGFEVDARSKDQASVDALLSGLLALLSGLTDGLPVGRIALTGDAEPPAQWCPPGLT